MSLALDQELLDAGKAIGLLDAGGNLNAAWFSDPQWYLSRALSDQGQRKALLDLFDQLLPAAPIAGLAAGEKWHPLLGDQPRGNLYLTIVPASGGSVIVGVAGEFRSSTSAVPSTSLRARLPIVSLSSSSASAIAGKANGPLDVSLRVELNWTRPAQEIALRAVLVQIHLAPLATSGDPVSFDITFEGLDLDGTGAHDTPLDPAHFDRQATNLVVGLISNKLHAIAATQTGEAAATATDLLSLLGLGDGIPLFPFAQLADGPAALQAWLNNIIASGKITNWLGHLIGLRAPAVVEGVGTPADPWRAPVFAPNANSSIELTLAVADQRLQVGLRAAIAPAGATPAAQAEAHAVIAAIPLAGSGAAVVLPSASAIMRAAGVGGPLVPAGGAISVNALRAGVSWNGTNLAPLLELLGVDFGGAHYGRIDLTNADSVVAAASAGVQAAIQAALGDTGAGRSLAALAGLVAPAGAPPPPFLVNPAALVANPTAEIARVHRKALSNWSFMLGELASLLGLGGTVSGSGTKTDPWRTNIAVTGPLHLDLAAWNAQESGVPGDVQKLRIGLRVSVTSSPWDLWWLAELLAFDLPAAGAGDVALMAGQHAAFVLQPVPTIPTFAGIAMAAASLGLTLDWEPGGALQLRARVNNVSVTANGVTTNIPVLSFPAGAGFDVNNPGASLGISQAQFEALVRAVLARAAYSWADMPGVTLAALLGLNGNLPRLPADWPQLGGGPGSVFADPLGALRDWLRRLAINVSADGTPFLPPALEWLRGLLAGALPPNPTTDLPSAEPLEGSGVYDDPWALTLATSEAQPIELLVWLEPAGPPANWVPAVATQINEAGGFLSLLDAVAKLSPFLSQTREAFAAADVSELASALTDLEAHLAESDGVVPVTSQIPTGGTWSAGTPLHSAHHRQPADPSAVTQILAQINVWHLGSTPRAVLYLGPAFSDHTVWQSLLAQAEAALPGSTSAAAHFDLRVPGVDPLSIDLRGVVTVRDHYTADLQDDGLGNLVSLTAQVDRLVARIRELRPGVKVTIVAHSTAGVAARSFTAANAALVQGLITIGTPHAGAPLLPVRDPAVAEALRLIERLFPTMPASPLTDAIAHLRQALDGFIAPAAPTDLPTPSPYPVGSFAGTTLTDTADVPARALGGPVDGELFALLKQAANALATTATGAATPTHLSFGLRAQLATPGAGAGQVAADTTIRVDVFRVALQPGTAEPARPAHALTVLAALSRPGGWLVGAPNAYAGEDVPPVDVRVRWAELGLQITPAAGNSISITPRVQLHQVAFHSHTQAVAQLGDALAEPLLGAVLHAIAPSAPAEGTPVADLLDAFEALGLAVPDAHGGIGLSADAFAAVQVDPGGYLEPRLLTALARAKGLLGFTGPAAGPWVMPIGGGPLEVYLSNNSPWEVGVRTADTARLELAANASLAFDARLSIPSMAAAFEVSFSVAATTVTWSSASGELVLAAPPWLDSLKLVPAPGGPALAAAFNQLIPRVLLSGVTTSVLEAAIGPGFRVIPIDRLLAAPAQTLSQADSLGNGSTLDAARIDFLLQLIGQAIGTPPGPGMGLPAGLRLTASGMDPVTLRLATTAPIGGVLNFQLDANIDSLFHVTPAGTLSLHFNLPGSWTGVTIAFGVAPSGVTLQVTPDGLPTIQLLPTFSGLGALAGTAQTLLPAVLDAVVDSFGQDQPPLMDLALRVATALDLYGSTKFVDHTDQLRAMTQGNWLSGLSTARNDVVTAVAQLFNDASSPLHGALPGTITASGSVVVWSLTPTGGAGTLSVTVGWDDDGLKLPKLTVEANGFTLNNGPLALTFGAGYASGEIQAQARLAFSLESSLGIAVTPQLTVAFTGGGFEVHVLPLGEGTAAALDIELLPTPGVAASDPLQFVETWMLPLVADLLVEATRTHLGTQLWAGGKTAEQILTGIGILAADGNVAPALPSLKEMVKGLLTSLVSEIPIPPTLTLGLVNDVTGDGGAKRLGLRLWGQAAFRAGKFDMSALFGEPADWIHDVNRGVTLFLFDADTFKFKPRLEVVGLGARFAGKDDAPLINTSFLRIGDIAGYLFFNVELAPGIVFTDFGAGVEITELGLPLGQALSDTGGDSNPVAASLLQSDGAGGGDPHPVNPTVNVVAVSRNGFSIRFNDLSGALWIGVHRQFGPIYIDQIGLEVANPPTEVALLVDGSVKVNGLTVQADDLSLLVPFTSAASPEKWTLDLRGLAVGYQGSGVSIAGGMVKNPASPISYDGMLTVDVAGKGFTAVGSYARPSDDLGSYTSLFIFVSLPLVLGGPPAFFVTGLGGGFGYNRQLLVPEDLNEIPNFVLVKAIDDSSLANDPMAALRSMALSIPPKRGSFWMAAGVRFDSFVLVHSVAVVYVALDRGFEIGILGISRMQLPNAEAPIVSVELALKARFNSEEGILSIQAQLTENSYLFDRSCRLTGGFAFFVWFPKGQFVLTLGGYHPAFQVPPGFPIVPRLGFQWNVSSAVVIKGEAFFALTNSCVMAGGRLEANFHAGPIRAWFIAVAEFLISWDPFHYDIFIGIQIGVAFSVRVCFIRCATIHIETSLGASLHVLGPPLHGEVRIDYRVVHITIAFGDSPRTQNLIGTFADFKRKYLTQGDPHNKAVGIKIAAGLLAPEPPGAEPAPGTREQPWRVNAEFVFVTETRMPADHFFSFLATSDAVVPDAGDLDLAAMGKTDVTSTHDLRIFIGDTGNTPPADAQHFAVERITSLFPEATWRYTHQGQERAAANTIRALSGLKLTGSVSFHGKSALIPISTLIDDDPTRALPLPFGTLTPTIIGTLKTFGVAAEALSGNIANATSTQMLSGAARVLAGGELVKLREAAGLPPSGISPLAQRSLRRLRSAPPLVAPLATGLTMKAAGLASPPVFFRVPDRAPVGLTAPRLSGVLQGRPQPTIDAPPALHTSVALVAKPDTPRTAPPQLAPLTGSRLLRVPAPTAPSPTEAAVALRTIHNLTAGLFTSVAHLRALEAASVSLTAKGVTLPAGTTHLWELPGGAQGGAFVITGDAAARVVFLDRAGRVVTDLELMTDSKHRVEIPAKTAMAAISCLGKLPAGVVAPAPGFGALRLVAAATNGFAAVGWEAGNYREQLSPSTVLGRGASLLVNRPAYVFHQNQKTTAAMIRVIEVIGDQEGVETWLPLSTSVVMVILEGQDVTAASQGDLAIAADGATLITPPIPVGGGRRRALLYDVGSRTSGADHLSIAAGSKAGWRVTGIVGLPGKALEWANRFHGSVPERIVPDGPLTPDGSLNVRLRLGGPV